MLKLHCTFLLLLVTNYAFAQQENPFLNSIDAVLKYNTQDFRKYVPSKNHYILFYAPWSGECKNVAGIWEELAMRFNGLPDGDVTLAKVDCTVETELCARQSISNYPTLKFFKVNGDPLGVRYRGAIDLASLEQFMNGNIGKETEFIYGARVPLIPEPEWGLHMLQDESFGDAVNSVSKSFIAFCTKWSSKCRELEPIWKQLAKEFRFEDDFIFGTIDCTTSKSTCDELGVKGYPSLFWLQDGDIDKFPLTSERTYDNLREFVLKKLGKTQVRTVPAGVEEEMDPTDIITLSKDDLYKAFEDKQMLFVQFWAPWCSLCLSMDNTWEALAANYNDKSEGQTPKILISYFDCTLNKETCDDLNAEVEALNVYKEGKFYKAYTGELTVDAMTQFVENIIDGKE